MHQTQTLPRTKPAESVTPARSSTTPTNPSAPLVIKGCIWTASKKLFNIAEPDPAMVDIHDIAHALSHICRFGGHTHKFYSVAQHSVRVSYVIETCLHSKEYIDAPGPKLTAAQLGLQALLHDATEAYAGDIVKPLKVLLPDYQVVEDRLWRVIARAFGLPDELHPLVHAVDRSELEVEQWNFFDREPSSPCLRVPLFQLSPKAARARFLERWNELNACPSARMSSHQSQTEEPCT